MHHPTDDRETAYVQRFLTFLSERRALHAPGARLKQRDTVISVEKIITKCRDDSAKLDENSPGAQLFQKIAVACRQFLVQAESASSVDFYIALGALRTHLADAANTMSVIYNIGGVIQFASAAPRQDYSRLASE